MPARSKRKGNSNERNTARILTEWWGAEFTRTPNSGALRWQGNTWTYGDLLPPEDCLCVFECKHEKVVRYDTLLKGTTNHHTILGWWKQVCDDTIRCFRQIQRNVAPVLIFKADRQPHRIAIEEDLYLSLLDDLDTHALCVRSVGVIPFAILDLREFCENVSKERFRHELSCLDKWRFGAPEQLVA